MILELLAPVLVEKVADLLSGDPAEKVEVVKSVTMGGDLVLAGLVAATEWVFRKIPSEKRLGIFSTLSKIFEYGHKVFKRMDESCDVICKPKLKEKGLKLPGE